MPAFNAIGIITTNMAETLAFYRRLGLDIPETAGDEGHVEVPIVNGFRIMFDTIEVIERFSTYEAPSGGRSVGFAFECESPTEVDALFAEITQAGYAAKQAPFDAFWGRRYATLLDPDGNPVDIYATSSAGSAGS